MATDLRLRGFRDIDPESVPGPTRSLAVDHRLRLAGA
jgi:hypothetical protein